MSAANTEVSLTAPVRSSNQNSTTGTTEYTRNTAQASTIAHTPSRPPRLIQSWYSDAIAPTTKTIE